MDIHNTGWLKITTHRLSLRHGRQKSVPMNVCVSKCLHAHAYMSVTCNASTRTCTSTHLYNPCLLRLGQWIWIKLQRVCICSHVDGGWILDSNCRVIMAWNAQRNPEHRWSWHFCYDFASHKPHLHPEQRAQAGLKNTSQAKLGFLSLGKCCEETV